MLRVFGASSPTLVLLLGAKVALARPACGSHGAVNKQLEQRHAEVPIAMALANSGKLIQVFASAGGVFRTVGLTQPDGTGCAAARGRVPADRDRKEARVGGVALSCFASKGRTARVCVRPHVPSLEAATGHRHLFGTAP